MLSTFRRFTKKIRAGCDRGVTLISYALVVSLIAVVSMVTVQAFGLNVSALFGNTGTQFDAIGVATTTTTTTTIDPAVALAGWQSQFNLPPAAYGYPAWGGGTAASSLMSAATFAASNPSLVNSNSLADYQYGALGNWGSAGQTWQGVSPSFSSTQILNGDPYYYWEVGPYYGSATGGDSTVWGSSITALGLRSASPGDPLYPIVPFP